MNIQDILSSPPNSGPVVQLLTSAQVGKMLGLSEQALAKQRLNGSGPPFHKLGRRVRYDIEELRRWLRERIYTSTSTS